MKLVEQHAQSTELVVLETAFIHYLILLIIQFSLATQHSLDDRSLETPELALYSKICLLFPHLLGRQVGWMVGVLREELLLRQGTICYKIFL